MLGDNRYARLGALLDFADSLAFDDPHAGLPREIDQHAHRRLGVQDCATRIIDAIRKRVAVELRKHRSGLSAVYLVALEPQRAQRVVAFGIKGRLALAEQQCSRLREYRSARL